MFFNQLLLHIYTWYVLDNRLIDIHSFWRPNIQIAKIAIHFSTNSYSVTVARRVLEANTKLALADHAYAVSSLLCLLYLTGVPGISYFTCNGLLSFLVLQCQRCLSLSYLNISVFCQSNSLLSSYSLQLLQPTVCE